MMKRNTNKSEFYYHADYSITTYRLKEGITNNFIIKNIKDWVGKYNEYCEERKTKDYKDREQKEIPEYEFNSENWLKITKDLNLNPQTKLVIICYRQTHHHVLKLKLSK